MTDDKSPIHALLELEMNEEIKRKIWDGYWLGCAEGYATCLQTMETPNRHIDRREDNVVYLRPLTNPQHNNKIR